MAKSNNIGDLLKSVADAIRTKKETSALINPQDFADEILSIESNPAVSKEPHIGDVAILLNGEKRFLTSLATAEQCANATKIGVVYDVEETEDGTIVRVVGDGNTTTKQWSCVADYEITKIPTASGSYAVKLNNVDQGSFAYTKGDGTIKEFCEQLNTWLRSQPSTAKAVKWESYYDDVKGKGFLQQYTYDEYESTNTIASTTLVKLIGTELTSFTTSENYNSIGQKIVYCGMSRDRLEAYCKTNTSANCNPTTAMNGTTQLYATYPVSETYYNGDLGVNLRAHYPTYQLYLDACMMKMDETRGVMGFRDGRMMTSLLLDKIVKKNGVATKAYTAAVYANEYTKGVAGFGQGDWWLPSMRELYKLMKDIRVDQRDDINNALGKCGYTKINPASYRWSSCRYSTSLAWNYSNGGVSSYLYFYSSLPVSVVSAFKI